jgi:hypothetical protein
VTDITTVAGYLAALDDDRRATIDAVRAVVLANLPAGYDESFRWGMLSYEIPLHRYPDTYNGKPLMYAALAAQKRYSSLYLTSVYSDPGKLERFVEAYRATGKRLDMGKSCVRFRTLDDLPLDVVADAIRATSVAEFVAAYEASRSR